MLDLFTRGPRVVRHKQSGRTATDIDQQPVHCAVTYRVPIDIWRPRPSSAACRCCCLSKGQTDGKTDGHSTVLRRLPHTVLLFDSVSASDGVPCRRRLSAHGARFSCQSTEIRTWRDIAMSRARVDSSANTDSAQGHSTVYRRTCVGRLSAVLARTFCPSRPPPAIAHKDRRYRICFSSSLTNCDMKNNFFATCEACRALRASNCYPPPIEERSIVMSAFVCLYVCRHAHLWNRTSILY